MSLTTLTVSFFFLPLLGLPTVNAQVSPKDSIVFTSLITTSISYNWPGGNLVDRFGNNGLSGVSFYVKTKSNWVMGMEGGYLFGNKVKEYGILDNLKTEQGFIIRADGTPSETKLNERGYLASIKTGRVFPVLPFTEVKLGKNPNSGIMLVCGPGFLQHKIRIASDAPQLDGDYKKGYDRLSYGAAVTAFLGYLFLSNKRLLNFYFGLDYVQAWTKNRRGYNYDTMQYDTAKRTDIMTGVKVGWVLPLYKKVPDEFYYN